MKIKLLRQKTALMYCKTTTDARVPGRIQLTIFLASLYFYLRAFSVTFLFKNHYSGVSI